MKHKKTTTRNDIFRFQISGFNNLGFSILEILVSIAIFALIFTVITSFIFWMNYSNSGLKSDREAGENAKRVMEAVIYEIRGAKSVYTPTTTASQLSLETAKYLPTGETNTFIDFFICGLSICLKKESQNPVSLLPDTVKATSLEFSQFLNGTKPSVKINLTVNSNDANNSSVNLISTAAPRTY